MEKPRHNNSLTKGIFAASLTPQREDLSIDHDALSEHVSWLFDRGCDGVAVFGTTGEAASFAIEERMQALRAVVEYGVAPERLLVGTGCCAVPDTITLTRDATSLGVGGVLILTPFFYKPNDVTDDGLFDAYKRVIQEVADDRIKVYLYHYPQMAGVGVGKDLVERLLDAFPEVIVGLKDSSGDWQNTKQICESFPQLDVYPGSEEFLADALEAGGAGCISATLNVASREAAEIYKLWGGKDVNSFQESLSGIRKIFEKYPLISALKYMMYKHSGRQDWLCVRPPLSVLSPDEGGRLERSLEAAGFSME